MDDSRTYYMRLKIQRDPHLTKWSQYVYNSKSFRNGLENGATACANAIFLKFRVCYKFRKAHSRTVAVPEIIETLR